MEKCGTERKKGKRGKRRRERWKRDSLTESKERPKRGTERKQWATKLNTMTEREEWNTKSIMDREEAIGQRGKSRKEAKSGQTGKSGTICPKAKRWTKRREWKRGGTNC
jgi:hypothetical protein